MKTCRLIIGGTLLVLGLAADQCDAGDDSLRDTVAIVCCEQMTPPVRHAVMRLRSALAARNQQTHDCRDIPVNGKNVFLLGTAADDVVLETLKSQRVALAEARESLVIVTVPDHTPPLVVIAGRDDRGLMYALYEVARAVETALRDQKLLDVIPTEIGAPFLRTRSLQVQIFNAELEADWYFDEDYWHGYFSLLAACRYNNFTLTFGHQTNYMNPVYAWLLHVNGYPEVRVKGLNRQARQRNLEMLERIARLAGEHGLDFTLGVWTQQPVEKYGRVYVEDFPDGDDARDYCAKALTRVLVACPSISGVQFRMNAEAGVSEDRQNDYFRQQFRAVQECRRQVRIDLRYKGLRQKTIADAVNTGCDVTVSTKFWCEHMGLPFHPTIEDDRWRESRYGYGAMLYKPRDYRVVYRLWSVGSQRLLLWGDPVYAARFARSCRLGGGEGSEVFAPLSNKGFGDDPGRWRVFADRDLEYFHHEYERYRLFYQVFGRAGYDPETSDDVWRREFTARFGSAADDVQEAFRQAGQVIPLLTATKLFSASEWRFWPEMSTGGLLEAYMHIQPSDYGQFYAIERWKLVKGWLAERWDSKHSTFVEDSLADRVQAKWTPIQVSARLSELADATDASVDRAREKWSGRDLVVEFRMTVNDLRIVAQLARYHAQKTLAATQIAFYRKTDEAGRLKQALHHVRRAACAWEAVVKLTDGVYSDNLVFGYDKQRAPSVDGVIRAHTGHWKDRLPEIQRDVVWVEELLRNTGKHSAAATQFKLLTGEVTPSERPRIKHRRHTAARAGEDLTIAADVCSKTPLRSVILHHRAMDQTRDWKQIRMEPTGGNCFKAVIPGTELSERYDHLYYLEARIAGGGTLWPNWQRETPYVVVRTIRNRSE